MKYKKLRPYLKKIQANDFKAREFEKKDDRIWQIFKCSGMGKKERTKADSDKRVRKAYQNNKVVINRSS